MPSVANKHQQISQLDVGGFRGGLNFASAPYEIEQNQLVLGSTANPTTGFLYNDSGQLTVVPRRHSLFNFTTDGVGGYKAFFLPSSHVTGVAFMVCQGTVAASACVFTHSMASAAFTKITTFGIGINFNNCAPCSVTYDNVTVVSLGTGNMFYIAGTGPYTVTNISGDNVPVNVISMGVIHGRLWVASSNLSTIRFSAVGDITNWAQSGAEGAIELEIGYKDGYNIVAVKQLYSDLIVFKGLHSAQAFSNDKIKLTGSIYRMSGWYPDWSVARLSGVSTTYNNNSAVLVGNDIYYLDSSGIRSMSSVADYGDFKISSLGDKINGELIKDICAGSFLYYSAYRNTLFIMCNANTGGNINSINTVYACNYNLGGAWSRYKLDVPSSSMMDFTNGAEGNYLYYAGYKDASGGYYTVYRTKLDTSGYQTTNAILPPDTATLNSGILLSQTGRFLLKRIQAKLLVTGGISSDTSPRFFSIIIGDFEKTYTGSEISIGQVNIDIRLNYDLISIQCLIKSRGVFYTLQSLKFDIVPI